MIDEKRLDDLRESIHNAGITSDRELDMLIRLARDGLTHRAVSLARWALEHGIPALEEIEDNECAECSAQSRARLALGKLPKGEG